LSGKSRNEKIGAIIGIIFGCGFGIVILAALGLIIYYYLR
jgi:hypothetical protein